MANWVELNTGVPNTDWAWPWGDISGNGETMVVAAGPAYPDVDVYISTDGGDTWNNKSPELGPWTYGGIALSNTGQHIALVLVPDQVTFASSVWISNDYGDTWTETSVTLYGQFCAMSDDGTKLYLSGSSNGVYKSSDSGANWTNDSFPADTSRIACSSDGSIILVSLVDGSAYLSTNSGTSWTQTLASGASTVDVSSTGTYLLASLTSDGISYSANTGATWNKIRTDDGSYNNIFVSTDGATIICSEGAGTTYVSYDSGATWKTDNLEAPHFIGSNNSGTFLLGQGLTTGIPYTYTGSLPSWPTITSITPNTGSTAGGTPVTIVGTGFDPLATAAIDGNALTDLVVVGPTSITGVTPAGTVGAKDVTVTNP